MSCRGDLGVTELCFAVDCSLLATKNLDAAFERIQASGAEVAEEPTDQPCGVRDCAIRDPAGNPLRVKERR